LMGFPAKAIVDGYMFAVKLIVHCN
jgi:hypothetical protein